MKREPIWIHHEQDARREAVATIETEFKGTVFNAATIEWGRGLYRDKSPVTQVRRNVLDRLGQ